MAWDEIRREVQYRLNLAAANWRMKKLNEVLPPIQERFEQALNEGVLLELEAGSETFVDDLLRETLAEASSR